MFLLKVTRTFSRLNTSVPVSAGQILKFILDQMHVTYANACKMKNLAWNAVRNVLEKGNDHERKVSRKNSITLY
jgi:hypothetical protein